MKNYHYNQIGNQTIGRTLAKVGNGMSVAAWKQTYQPLYRPVWRQTMWLVDGVLEEFFRQSVAGRELT